jgi:aminomethyltransferase
MMTRDEAQPADGQPRPTPLRAIHESLGATMTDFAGWLMPLRYRSETAEHRAVRGAAGLFDLSHMGEIAVSGPGAAAHSTTHWSAPVGAAAGPRAVHDDLRTRRRGA